MRLSTFKKAFGTNIKKQRMQKNLTQSELAEKLGIDTSSLGKLECGINFTSAKMLLKISSVLDINPAELFNFGDKIKIKPDAETNDKFEKIFELLLGYSEDELESIYNILNSVLNFKNNKY